MGTGYRSELMHRKEESRECFSTSSCLFGLLGMGEDSEEGSPLRGSAVEQGNESASLPCSTDVLVGCACWYQRLG